MGTPTISAMNLSHQETKTEINFTKWIGTFKKAKTLLHRFLPSVSKCALMTLDLKYFTLNKFLI